MRKEQVGLALLAGVAGAVIFVGASKATVGTVLGDGFDLSAGKTIKEAAAKLRNVLSGGSKASDGAPSSAELADEAVTGGAVQDGLYSLGGSRGALPPYILPSVTKPNVRVASFLPFGPSQLAYNGGGGFGFGGGGGGLGGDGGDGDGDSSDETPIVSEAPPAVPDDTLPDVDIPGLGDPEVTDPVVDAQPTPLPGAAWLALAGFAGLVARRRF